MLGCSADVLLCGSDQDCGPDGTCQATSYCSYPDPSCDSEQRYGDNAGDGLDNTCVQDPLSVGDSGSGAMSGETSTSPPSTSISLDGAGSTDEGTTTPAFDTSTTIEPDPDTGPGSTGTVIERVTDGLLVLYEFEEGAGTTVMDVGGVGTPLDLEIESNDFTWVADGLLLEEGIVRSQVPATKIIEGCQATDGLTVEAWVTPLMAAQEGPARIVTLSETSSFRNFTVGQGVIDIPTALFVGRLRTSDDTGSDNGGPQILTGTIATNLETHLAYVRDSDEDVDRLYVNGQSEATGPRSGDFSGWDPTFEFACGNELTLDRQWQGTLHLVAVYDRALTHEEIIQNIDAGH